MKNTNDRIRFVESNKDGNSSISNAIKESLTQEAIQMGILPPAASQEKESCTADKMAPTKEPSPQDAQPVSYRYVNVMEHGVRELCGEYMEKLGVCHCDRCRSDIMALALNNLPPKYIVADQSREKPLLSYYNGKYALKIRAELTKACFTVMGNPRHQSA